ncbi:endonuclease/exonuclease/phosphatase family protein [Hydrogenimonas sp. SS33]|uniref:endonuclease/exonuclease/phosphatase family protein n=1 Tax=Hydrogenimonas leucolamina TaxID=2954236 RepID=UPI00336BBF3D
MKLSLLCWNVQKRTLSARFRHILADLDRHYPTDLWMLQEVRLRQGRPFPFPDHLERAQSCNIRGLQNCFGVATLSRFPIEKAESYLSDARELGFATRKSALLTAHRLPDGTTLQTLNVHAINFVPYRLFEKEMDRLEKLLEKMSSGRLVVGGDFNTWSPRRQKRLREMMGHYGLAKAEPREEHLVKSFLGRPLDQLFYRGLTFLDAVAIDISLSDHNPIHFRFTTGV